MSEPETDVDPQLTSELTASPIAEEKGADHQANHPTAHSLESPTITDLKDRQLGDFKLLRRIGKGGMAEVYLAEQSALKRNVAVKVLREEMLGDAVHLQRFEQEAKAAGGLNHPNIVQVYTIGHDDGVHYIAQEYVQGMNLREYLSRNGPPDLATALEFMRQIASALEASSEAGIVHRDIKPENILITRKNQTKITDFGLAQLSLPGEQLHLTQVGMTMGTPLYMSPEQVNGRNVDHRSDLYSMGVTCYHMLCGSTPFRGETALSVAIQHVNADPPPLKVQRPDLPEIVCKLVHRLMAKVPDDRYQNAEQVVDDIERIQKVVAENPSVLAKMKLSDIGLPPGMSRWLAPFVGWGIKKQIAVFVISALCVGGVAAAVGMRNRPPDPFATPAAEPKEKIPRYATAQKQLDYAIVRANSEDAWKAVIERFPSPDDANSRRVAMDELALLYVRTRRYEEAAELYRQLTLLDEKEEKWRASGHAGLYVIASLKGRHEDSSRIFATELLPLLKSLCNARPPKLTRSDPLYILVRNAYDSNNARYAKDGRKRPSLRELIFGRS